MSQNPPSASPGSISQLQTQYSRLRKAITDIQSEHTRLTFRWSSLNPVTVGNPLVHYTYRDACSTAFVENVWDEPFQAEINKSLVNHGVAGRLLGNSQVGEADVVLRGVAERLRRSQDYVQKLKKAVEAHYEVERYLVAKGLVGDRKNGNA
ncbi:Hypothetical predicted protein [Lecanosticta acicola]|uniref:Uncharacterized protein n=1 Tax=Lecanosticta acicola TaxID=111012 RepID=A0AAI9EEB1_9PEZI|nr:Hypothetical predicted protein [Lecanosticta acicola]